MNKIQINNIIEGKRNRVMSKDGVMAVVTKEILKHTIKKQQPKQVKTHQQIEATEKKRKSVAADKVVQAEETPSQREQEQPLKEDNRIQITREALKEMIQKHFIIIDQVPPSTALTNKQRIRKQLLQKQPKIKS